MTKKKPFRIVIPSNPVNDKDSTKCELCNERATLAIEKTDGAQPPNFYTYICTKRFDDW